MIDLQLQRLKFHQALLLVSSIRRLIRNASAGIESRGFSDARYRTLENNLEQWIETTRKTIREIEMPPRPKPRKKTPKKGKGRK